MKITIFALLMTSSLLAQKKELKLAETSITIRNFNVARNNLNKVKPNLEKLNAVDKSRYHLYTGQVLAFDKKRANLGNFKKAINEFNKVLEVEKKSKKFKNTKIAKGEITHTLSQIEQLAYEANTAKNHDKAIGLFKFLYNKNPKDTIHLFNAAANAVNAKKYDAALKDFNKLLKLGFTGIAPVYKAKSVSTGKEEFFKTKEAMDKEVSKKKYVNPETSLSKSLKGEITKNIALIYFSKGETEKAEAAFAKAKAENPNDKYLQEIEAQLFVDTANKYLKEGKKEEALEIYKKALEGNPKNAAIHQNIASIILERDKGFVEKLNSLTTSKEDQVIYKEYEAKRKANFEEAAKHLEHFLEIVPNNKTIANSLYQIYSNTKNPKAAQVKAKYGL